LYKKEVLKVYFYHIIILILFQNLIKSEPESVMLTE